MHVLPLIELLHQLYSSTHVQPMSSILWCYALVVLSAFFHSYVVYQMKQHVSSSNFSTTQILLANKVSFTWLENVSADKADSSVSLSQHVLTFVSQSTAALNSADLLRQVRSGLDQNPGWLPKSSGYFTVQRFISDQIFMKIRLVFRRSKPHRWKCLYCNVEETFKIFSHPGPEADYLQNLTDPPCPKIHLLIKISWRSYRTWVLAKGRWCCGWGV